MKKVGAVVLVISLLFASAHGSSTSHVLDYCHKKGFQEWALHKVKVHRYGMEVNDRYGQRVYNVKTVRDGGCRTISGSDQWDRTAETGDAAQGYTSGLLTYISLGNPSGTTGECTINKSTSPDSLTSFQGIHVYGKHDTLRAQARNGMNISLVQWLIQPEGMAVYDVGAVNGMKKAVYVFGYTNTTNTKFSKNFIEPTWDLTGSSLVKKDVQLSTTTLDNLVTGMTGPKSVPGVQASGTADLLCSFGTFDPKCGAKFSFSTPIDGFFIIAALDTSGTNVVPTSITVGPIREPCGCRCRPVFNNGGTYNVLEQVSPGKCKYKSVPDKRWVCNYSHLSANMWCERKKTQRYFIVSNQPFHRLPQTGTFDCVQRDDVTVNPLRYYNPVRYY